MTAKRTLLICWLVLAPAANAFAQSAAAQQAPPLPPQPPQPSQGPTGSIPRKPLPAAAKAPAPAPTPAAVGMAPAVTAPQPTASAPATTPAVAAAPAVDAKPLAGVAMLHVELLPVQGDVERCGLEAASLRTAATYPLAASARLKVGRATLAHMLVRLSAVHVARLDHCIIHLDVRVASLQQVELAHSRAATTAYVPLWERADVRLSPRAQAGRTAQDRLRQIAEALVVDWAAQN